MGCSPPRAAADDARVSEVWILAALALLTVRWWWAVLAVLVLDLRVAGEPREHLPALPDRLHASSAPSGVSPATRAPLNRVLAFRGVEQRVAARQRWEAGFGRRGL